MFREKNTADQIWETLEFKDLQDEVTGPTMTGNSDCSFSCTNSCSTSGSSCVTNAGCSSQIGCSTRSGCINPPAPGMKKK